MPRTPAPDGRLVDIQVEPERIVDEWTDPRGKRHLLVRVDEHSQMFRPAGVGAVVFVVRGSTRQHYEEGQAVGSGYLTVNGRHKPGVDRF